MPGRQQLTPRSPQGTPASFALAHWSECQIQGKCSVAACFGSNFCRRGLLLTLIQLPVPHLVLTTTSSSKGLKQSTCSATCNTAPDYAFVYHCMSVRTSRNPQCILVRLPCCTFSTAEELCIQELELLCCYDILDAAKSLCVKSDSSSH